MKKVGNILLINLPVRPEPVEGFETVKFNYAEGQVVFLKQE